MILEVGLGGRLDATNIIAPNLAVITSIDIDHVAFLGDNREDIGREKAGIFRENIPVVIGEPDCPNSMKQIANSLNCHAFTEVKTGNLKLNIICFIGILKKNPLQIYQCRLFRFQTPAPHWLC